MARIQRDRVFRPIYPSPAALVSCVAADGTPNIITLGEVFNISIGKPVVVGLAIAPERYSYELIRDSGEFVVNLPTAAMVETVDRCGTVSGRTVGDKFAYAGLTPLPGSVVSVPLIAECPMNIECRLIDILPAGDHDLFRGEAVAEHVDEACLDAEGRILVARLSPLIYARGEYWSVGEKLGTHGYSRRGGDGGD